MVSNYGDTRGPVKNHAPNPGNYWTAEIYLPRRGWVVEQIVGKRASQKWLDDQLQAFHESNLDPEPIKVKLSNGMRFEASPVMSVIDQDGRTTVRHWECKLYGSDRKLITKISRSGRDSMMVAIDEACEAAYANQQVTVTFDSRKKTKCECSPSSESTTTVD